MPCLQEPTLLAQLLASCSGLVALDLSRNPRLPDRLLQGALDGAAMPCHESLTQLSLAGCDLVAPGYSLALHCGQLRELDISCTASTDAGKRLTPPAPAWPRPLMRACWLAARSHAEASITATPAI
jgi:hypothetical protein